MKKGRGHSSAALSFAPDALGDQAASSGFDTTCERVVSALIFSLRSPRGSWIETWSPTFLPVSVWPSGEATEI